MSTRVQLGYLAAGLTLILGLLGLLNPLLSVRLHGLEVVDPRGLSEVRATFGALFVVMGATMLWALPTRRRRSAWMRLPGMLWLGAALGRVVSMSLDRALTLGNILALLLALVIGLSALAASFGDDAGTTLVEAAREEDPPDPLSAYRG